MRPDGMVNPGISNNIEKIIENVYKRKNIENEKISKMRKYTKRIVNVKVRECT